MTSSARTRAVVVGSAGLHGIVLLAVSRCSFERPIRERVEIDTPSVEITEVTMGIDVVTLSPGIDPSLLDPIEASRGPGHNAPRIATSAGSATSGSRSETPPISGESLRMRGRRHDLQLPPSALDRIVTGGKPLQQSPHDERLQPNGGGEHVIYDRVTTVKVARDGRATFADKKDIDPKLTLPIMTFDEIRTGIGNHLSAWYADPYRDQRAGRMQDLPRHLTAVPGACESLNDPACDTEPDDRPLKKSLSRGFVPVVGGNADITAWLHRKFIGDPYASRKLKLLDTTRDARAQIGTNHRSEQRDRASELAQRNVDALLRAIIDPVQRRAALFEMWDECVEGEGPDGEAGDRARAIVMGSIRAKLPAGSPGAFTPDEIAKLDAGRTSRQHFAPY